MVQGGIAGATDYSKQSIDDILKDIVRWIKIADSMIVFNTEFLAKMENNELWAAAPYDFKSSINQSRTFWSTAKNDLSIVQTSINNKNITPRDIKLLQKIGKNAIELDHALGVDYNSTPWQKYDDPRFDEISEHYSENRDYICTLIDVGNAASRLEDYAMDNNINISNSFNTDNSINGSFNKSDLKGTQIQVGNNNSAEQTHQTNQDIPFDKILKQVLIVEDEVKVCRSQSDELQTLYDEAVIEAQNGNNPSKLKEILEKIGNIAKGIGNSIIQNAVIAALTYFEKKNGL